MMQVGFGVKQTGNKRLRRFFPAQLKKSRIVLIVTKVSSLTVCSHCLLPQKSRGLVLKLVANTCPLERKIRQIVPTDAPIDRLKELQTRFHDRVEWLHHAF